MEWTSRPEWHPGLLDPSGQRAVKPRQNGQTMIIDKGLGVQTFAQLLDTAGAYIDIVKIGFGSCVLYPRHALADKINIAREHCVHMMPGGTFLEMAVYQHAVDDFFDMIHRLGFTGIEVSDGIIDMNRATRNELIDRGRQLDLQVFTEYGKKLSSESFHIEQLAETVELDLLNGAEQVTIEGRESGKGAGLYDQNGRCQDEDLREIIKRIPNTDRLMWETPLKSQQVQLIRLLGANVNLGNIHPEDILSLECLRRGLRADTFPSRTKPQQEPVTVSWQPDYSI